MNTPQSLHHVHFHSIEDLRRHWGWFFLLGLILIVLGLLAIGASTVVTLISVVFLGILLIIGGAAQFVYSFWAHQWSGTLLSLLVGLLYLVTGILCVAKPALSAMSITLLIGSLCLVGGLFRAIGAAFLRFHNWGWVLFNGLVTFALGLLILADWPVSGLWVIGLFVGIDLLLSGWTWILLSLTSRKLLQ